MRESESTEADQKSVEEPIENLLRIMDGLFNQVMQLSNKVDKISNQQASAHQKMSTQLEEMRDEILKLSAEAGEHSRQQNAMPSSIERFSRERLNGCGDPLFVAPPPPYTEESSAMGGHSKPEPFLAHLEKRDVAEEFGFNLLAEKGVGEHYVITVDKGSIADRAGLKMGQRVVGVNGVLVHPTTRQCEVVALMRRKTDGMTLLVAAEDVYQWYKRHYEPCSFDYATRRWKEE